MDWGTAWATEWSLRIGYNAEIIYLHVAPLFSLFQANGLAGTKQIIAANEDHVFREQDYRSNRVYKSDNRECTKHTSIISLLKEID